MSRCRLGLRRGRSVCLILASGFLTYYFIYSLVFSSSSTNESKSKHKQTEINTFFAQMIAPPGILLNPIGGIGNGNQLFQYACSYALAKDKNWPLYVFTGETTISNREFKANQREFSLDQFHIPELNLVNQYTIARNVSYVNDNDYLTRRLPDASNGFIQLDMNGHCSSMNYWTNYTDEMKTLFLPSEDVALSMPDNVKSVLSEIENTESVALHIRRGDFLHISKGDEFIVPISFQRTAIRRMIKILKEKNAPIPIFFVFSDDINFAMREFKDFEENYKFVYVSDLKTTSLQEFYLMIKCKHIILPNSTFGWWAAYLNSNVNKIIIATAWNPEFWKLWEGEWKVFKRRLFGTLYHPSSWIVLDPFSGEE